jgi:hypothetical protein
MITFIQMVLGGVLGGVLAFNGLTILTWSFWAVVVLVFGLVFTSVYDN